MRNIFTILIGSLFFIGSITPSALAIGSDLDKNYFRGDIHKVEKTRNAYEKKNKKTQVSDSKDFGLRVDFGSMKFSPNYYGMSFGEWFSYDGCGSKGGGGLYRKYVISKDDYVDYTSLYDQYIEHGSTTVAPKSSNQNDTPYSYENPPIDAERAIETGTIHGIKYIITVKYIESSSCGTGKKVYLHFLGKKYNYTIRTQTIASDNKDEIMFFKKILNGISIY